MIAVLLACEIGLRSPGIAVAAFVGCGNEVLIGCATGFDSCATTGAGFAVTDVVAAGATEGFPVMALVFDFASAAAGAAFTSTGAEGLFLRLEVFIFSIF